MANSVSMNISTASPRLPSSNSETFLESEAFFPSLTEKVMHAFVMSRLDYCNSLFTGLPNKTVHRLQLIQNSAAQVGLLTRTKNNRTT